MGERLAGDKPLLFATVGTDHHPFDRLVRWVDGWLGDGGSGRVQCLVQTGATRVEPRYADAVDYLEYDAMREAMKQAALVVCHGGPATIMLAVAAGSRPVVVPRLRRLGEHVDDHQAAFSRRIAREQTIALAESEDRFRMLLDEAVDRPDRNGPLRLESSSAEAVRRFEALVDELVAGKRGGRHAA